MNDSLEQVDAHKMFGGEQLRFKHASSTLNCSMHFSVFLPSRAKQQSVPVIYWLSGLTCDDQNFVTKAGAQQYAEIAGVAIVTPDTSPRGDAVPDDPEAAYDFGLGAGFYVDATQAPWDQHYQMYSYIVHELPQVLRSLPVDTQRASIMGHSMGGHGAITIALKNTDKFKSVSAFSPICAPMNCPWGEKALSQYVGLNSAQWLQYDSCELIKQAKQHVPLLVDQGAADNFLDEQLKTPLLIEAAEHAGYDLSVRMQSGYDHSYFFIASFIEDHIKFHARYL